jgi:hypothetical protein
VARQPGGSDETGDRLAAETPAPAVLVDLVDNEA